MKPRNLFIPVCIDNSVIIVSKIVKNLVAGY